jgi:hypothetical protein
VVLRLLWCGILQAAPTEHVNTQASWFESCSLSRLLCSLGAQFVSGFDRVAWIPLVAKSSRQPTNIYPHFNNTSATTFITRDMVWGPFWMNITNHSRTAAFANPYAIWAASALTCACRLSGKASIVVLNVRPLPGLILCHIGKSFKQYSLFSTYFVSKNNGIDNRRD